MVKSSDQVVCILVDKRKIVAKKDKSGSYELIRGNLEESVEQTVTALVKEKVGVACTKPIFITKYCAEKGKCVSVYLMFCKDRKNASEDVKWKGGLDENTHYIDEVYQAFEQEQEQGSTSPKHIMKNK